VPKRTTRAYANSRRLCQLDRHRWQIQLFLKALKRSLKITTFVGLSENVVNTPVWTARIATLLLKCTQEQSPWQWNPSSLAAMLRFNLLTCRDLRAWLGDPLGVPIRDPEPIQLTPAP